MSHRPKAVAASLLAITLLVSLATHAEDQEDQDLPRETQFRLGYVLPTWHSPVGELAFPFAVLTTGTYGKYFGTEVRVGFGLDQSTDIYGDTYEVADYYGVFERVNLFVSTSSRVVPYALAGYYSWKLVPSYLPDGFVNEGTVTGLGLDFKVIDKVVLNFEYTLWEEQLEGYPTNEVLEAFALTVGTYW